MMRNGFVFRGLTQRLPVVWLGFLLGCAGGGDGYEGPRGEVTGKVTFKGASVPEGSIVLFQTKEGPSYLATGAVKADGTFQLVYQGSKEMPCTSYVVQVSPPPSKAPAAEIDPLEAAEKALQTTTSAEPVELPFPAKYTSINTSGLTFDVEPGKNVAELELTEN